MLEQQIGSVMAVVVPELLHVDRTRCDPGSRAGHTVRSLGGPLLASVAAAIAHEKCSYLGCIHGQLIWCCSDAFSPWTRTHTCVFDALTSPNSSFFFDALTSPNNSFLTHSHHLTILGAALMWCCTDICILLYTHT